MLTPGGGHRVRGGAVSLAGTRGFPPSHLVDTRRFVLGSTTTHIFLGIKLSKSLFSKVPGDRQGGWVEPKKNYIILFLVSFLKTRSWFCLSCILSVWYLSPLEELRMSWPWVIYSSTRQASLALQENLVTDLFDTNGYFTDECTVLERWKWPFCSVLTWIFDQSEYRPFFFYHTRWIHAYVCLPHSLILICGLYH